MIINPNEGINHSKYMHVIIFLSIFLSFYIISSYDLKIHQFMDKYA